MRKIILFIAFIINAFISTAQAYSISDEGIAFIKKYENVYLLHIKMLMDGQSVMDIMDLMFMKG